MLGNMVAAVERANLHILVQVTATTPDEMDCHLGRENLVGRVVGAGQRQGDFVREQRSQRRHLQLELVWYLIAFNPLNFRTSFEYLCRVSTLKLQQI